MPFMVLTQCVEGPFTLPFFFASFALQHLLFTQYVQAHFLVKESVWLSSHLGARQYLWPLTSPWIGCQIAGAMVRELSRHEKFSGCDLIDMSSLFIKLVRIIFTKLLFIISHILFLQWQFYTLSLSIRSFQ